MHPPLSELMISELSISQIDKEIFNLKDKENSITANLISLLAELDKRKAFRDLGYSSLFMYCTERLGYSEGAAYRRIQAARVLQSNPEIYQKLKDGKLNLCSISEIAKVKESSVKSNLLITSEGKSRREVQAMAAKHLPAELPKRETIRAKVVEDKSPLNLSITSMAKVNNEYRADENKQTPTTEVLKYSFNMEVDEEFMKLYREVKELIGHVPAAEVFKRTLSEFVSKRKELKRKVQLKTPENSRFIPKETKLKVINRDKKQCCFISADGRRCSEKHGLQFDHIKPYAMGGDNSESNVRLLCKAHNLFNAESVFGKEKINKLIAA